MIIIDATCITSATGGCQVFDMRLLNHLPPKLAGQEGWVLIDRH